MCARWRNCFRSIRSSTIRPTQARWPMPAFTPEIGAARILDHDMIALFVEGTMNVLKLHKIIAGPMGRTGKDSGLFIGNSGHGVFATRGGFVEFLIELNDKVTAG